MKATLGWLAGIFATLLALVVGAFRAGSDRVRRKDAEDALDEVAKAERAEAGVDALTADARRDKLRSDWTR